MYAKFFLVFEVSICCSLCLLSTLWFSMLLPLSHFGSQFKSSLFRYTLPGGWVIQYIVPDDLELTVLLYQPFESWNHNSETNG